MRVPATVNGNRFVQLQCDNRDARALTRCSGGHAMDVQGCQITN